jgi:hypothetical protein
MTRDKSSDKGVSITWLNAAVASTAIGIGCVLFVGHETLASRLQLFFGYQATPFSIYNYDEVLMVGVDTIFRILAPYFLMSGLIVLLIHHGFSARMRRIMVVLLAIPLALLLLVTPMAVGHKARLFMLPHWKWALMTVFLAIIASTVELLSGNLKIPVANWILTGLVITGWAFVLWFSPRMVPIQLGCFPKATIRFNDGRTQSYSFLAERQDTFVMGDNVRGHVVFVPLSQVTEVAIEDCR